MFERFERELLPREKRLLSQKLSSFRARRHKSWITLFVFWFGLSALSSLAIFFGKGKGGEIPRSLKGWGVLGMFCLWLVIGLWSMSSARKHLSKQIARLEEALSRNRAAVTRIASEQMVEFEEIEDEGACYAFQVAENKITFVSGQEYYPSAKFPNSDFDIVDISASDGFPVEGGIEKRGKKLAPLRRIIAKAKETLTVPDDLSVIDGKLEDLEELLRAPNRKQ
jgi:hypothetical protein